MKSCPYTPQQNGMAERKHRHLVETTITLLSASSLALKFWFHACSTANYLINGMPTKALDMKSPFEKLFGLVPDVTTLKVFGSACYPLLRPYNHNKLQDRTDQCVFIGYTLDYKGYMCYHIASARVYVSRHVIFDE